MILDSISAISEIAPYYGNLDDVYRLMRRGNRKMHKVWNDIGVKLSERIYRKIVFIDFKSIVGIVDASREWPFILVLFIFILFL